MPKKKGNKKKDEPQEDVQEDVAQEDVPQDEPQDEPEDEPQDFPQDEPQDVPQDKTQDDVVDETALSLFDKFKEKIKGKVVNSNSAYIKQYYSNDLGDVKAFRVGSISILVFPVEKIENSVIYHELTGQLFNLFKNTRSDLVKEYNNILKESGQKIQFTHAKYDATNMNNRFNSELAAAINKQYNGKTQFYNVIIYNPTGEKIDEIFDEKQITFKDEDEFDDSIYPDDSMSYMGRATSDVGTDYTVNTDVMSTMVSIKGKPYSIGSLLGSTLRKRNVGLTRGEIDNLAKQDPELLPIIRDYVLDNSIKNSKTEEELVENLRNVKEINKLERSINSYYSNKPVVVRPNKPIKNKLLHSTRRNVL